MPTTKHGYKIKRLTMLQNEMKYGRMTVNSFSENEVTLQKAAAAICVFK